MQQHTKRDKTSRPSPLSQQRWRWGIRLDRSCEQNSGDRQPPAPLINERTPTRNATPDVLSISNLKHFNIFHSERALVACDTLSSPLGSPLPPLLPDFSFDATPVDSIGPLQSKSSVHSGPRPSPVLAPV